MSVLEAASMADTVKKPLVASPDLMSGKPSLIGLTREEMGEALRAKGVAEKQCACV